MPLLTNTEFTLMEHLLAGLLTEAEPREEEQILHLHARLKSIFEVQRGLNNTKAHLLNLTKQIP